MIEEQVLGTELINQMLPITKDCYRCFFRNTMGDCVNCIFTCDYCEQRTEICAGYDEVCCHQWECEECERYEQGKCKGDTNAN